MPAFSDITHFFFGAQSFGKTFVPDINLSGKNIIITGANTGFGFEAAKHLARHNVSHLILGCRNLKKGEAARSAILAETKAANTSIELPRLDAFVANAGIEIDRLELAEGLGMTLTVNVVSTFMCALAVLPKLKETTRQYSTTTTLSFVGSMAHIFGADKSLDIPEGHNILDVLSRPNTDMSGRYPLSKLIEHLCFNGLSEIVSAQQGDAKSRVVLNIVNPAWCISSLGLDRNKGAAERFFASFLRRTTEMGSGTLAHGAMAGEEFDGCYLSECMAKPQSVYVRSARGKEAQKRLWREVMARVEKVSPKVAGFVR